MSKEKTLIDKVKDLVFEKETPKEEVKKVEIKLAEVTTADGVILKYENLDAGTAIVVVDAEGEESPASGDYTLEDGTVIVTAEGAVVEVKEVEVEEEEEAEMETEDPTADLKKELENVLSQFKALDEKFEAQAKEFAAFKSEPAVEEIKLSKKDVQISTRETALQGISKYRS